MDIPTIRNIVDSGEGIWEEMRGVLWRRMDDGGCRVGDGGWGMADSGLLAYRAELLSRRRCEVVDSEWSHINPPCSPFKSVESFEK
jgi:hypothetical protein